MAPPATKESAVKKLARIGLVIAAAGAMFAPATAAQASTDPLDIVWKATATCPPGTYPRYYVYADGHEVLVCY
jgi:hypothetical protein